MGKTNDSKDLDVLYRLNRIKDRYNNEINYKYDTTTKALLQISYSNNIIDFIYENRSDKRKFYNQGIEINLSKRLKKISIKTNNIEISSYTLAYNTINEQSFLKSITETRKYKTLKPILFNWNYKLSTGRESAKNYYSVAGDFYNDWKVITRDMNGDGLIDIVRTYSGTLGHRILVSLNTGNGFEAEKSWYSNAFYFLSLWKISIKDMNGDGLPDYVLTYDQVGYKINVALNKGNGFDTSKLWYNQANSLAEGENIYTQDMNGDGLVDVVKTYKGTLGHKLDVALNTSNIGNKFENFKSWYKNTSSSLSQWDIYVKDVNNDGLADLVTKYKGNNINIGLNTGTKFSPLKSWYQNANLLYSYYNIDLKDINGDGLMDLVQSYSGFNGQVINVGINKGNFFSNPKVWLSASNLLVYKLYPEDMDGDGLADLVQVLENKISGYKLNVAKNNGILPTLNHITNNKNEDINISYSKLLNNAIYSSTNSLTYPNLSIKKAGLKVVKNYTILDGIGGLNKTSFTYKNLGLNIERSSLGFEEIIKLDETKNMKVIEKYSQAFPYIGALNSSKTYINNKMVSENEFTFNKKINSNIYQIYLSKAKKVIFDYATSNRLTTKTITNSNIDKYGNIGVKTTVIDGNNSEIIKRIETKSYSNNESKWLISKLTNLSTRYEATGRASITKTLSYLYDPYTGKLLKETEEPNNQKSISTVYAYDTKGNIISKTITDNNIDITTSFKYDSLGKNLTKVINVLDHSESYTYNNRNQIISTTNVNGLSTLFEYDVMNRKIKETSPDGNYITWDYQWTSSGYKVTKKLNDRFPEVKYYDKLGRIIREDYVGFDGRTIIKEIEYDKRGNKKRITTPYFDNETPKYIYYSYDALDRLIKTNSPAPHNTRVIDTIQYLGFKKIETNDKGQVKTTRMNSLGDINYVNDNDTSSISYEYDAVGNLLKTIDSNNNIISIEYDIFGNKIKQNDPDLGVWTYDYNAFKQVVSQTDAKGQTTTFVYDKLGRVLTKTTPEGKISFGYDTGNNAIGKIVEERSSGSLKIYTYDNLERLSSITTKVDLDNIYTQKYSYDSLGRLEKTVEPNNVEINNHYNVNGYLESVTTPKENIELSEHVEIYNSNEVYFYKVLEQNSLGITTSYLSGNGLITTAQYDESGIVYNMKTIDAQNQNIRNLSFEYDSLNNVTRRVDSKLNVEHNYIYDSLNRLNYVSIDKKDSSSIISYQYDSLGNMTYKSDLGTYEYSSSKPHAVTKIGGKSFTYDANGNMINSNGKTITYNSFNKPTKIQTSNKAVMFFYDGSENRYKKVSSDEIVHYLGKTYEKNIYSNGITVDKYFIYAEGKLVSIFTKRDNQYDINFLYYDNLGSIDTITNSIGEVLERRAYKPFGEQLSLDKFGNEIESNFNITNRGFIGHELIQEVNLVHMNGRIYDPTIARFISADPTIPYVFDSQSFNRYSYTMNNPLKYIDLNGFHPDSINSPENTYGDKGHGKENIGSGNNGDGGDDNWQKASYYDSNNNIIGEISYNSTTADYSVKLNNGATFGDVGGTVFAGDGKGNFVGNYNNGESTFGVKANGDFDVIEKGILHRKRTGTIFGIDYKIEFKADLAAQANALRYGAKTLDLLGTFMLSNPATSLYGTATLGLGLLANGIAEYFDPTSLSKSVRNSLLDIMSHNIPGGIGATFAVETYNVTLDYYAGD